MTEPLDSPSVPTNEKGGTKLLIGAIALLVIYAIVSIMAMDDLWKYDVDQRYGTFFQDPMYHHDSGIQYLYISLVILAGSLACFFLYIRKKRSSNFIVHGILAGLFVIIGLYFLASTTSMDRNYMQFIQDTFYPIWSFSLAGIFVAMGLSAFLNKRSNSSLD